MVNLLHLTRASGIHGETDAGAEITLNGFQIMIIEDSHATEPGASKVVMSNGKIFFLQETQAEIRAQANAGGVI
jgi:hypothetical protein